MTKQFRIGRISSPVVASGKDKERYWKRIMIVDDDIDILATFRVGIENATMNSNKRNVIDAFNDLRIALLDFQPNFYDLLLIDINMPTTEEFQLSEEFWKSISMSESATFLQENSRMFYQKASHNDYLIGRVMT